jgi:hypothetical protein
MTLVGKVGRLATVFLMAIPATRPHERQRTSLS